jgi:hypothetical protein
LKSTGIDSLGMCDVEGYAIASCLANQSQTHLKDQGDAWASTIVQRMRESVEVFADIAEQVKRENAKGDMAIIRYETGPEKTRLHIASAILQ